MSEGQSFELVLTAEDHADWQVRCDFTVTARVDDQFSHLLDIPAAVSRDDSSFLHEMTPAMHQVLQSEILAGLLTGMRGQRRSWHVELRRLGADIGTSRDIGEAPSIAFAVAATLVMRHATGAEDLVAKPHGGHGWRLTSITVD